MLIFFHYKITLYALATTPKRLMSWQVFSAPSMSISKITILQPHLANPKEIARPKPFPPPVTYLLFL